MPSVSEKQARFMAAAAHDPGFAKRAGISQSVAQEFNQADKGGSILHKAMTQQYSRNRTVLHELMGRGK